MSFTDLAYHFDAVVQRMENGERVLNDFIAFIESRMAAELAYTQALQRIGTSVVGEQDTGTIFEALNAVKCDSLNNAKVRNEFYKQLREEVLEPSTDLKRTYTRLNQKLIRTGRECVRDYKSTQQKFFKAKARYERAQRESQEAREKLIEAKVQNANNQALTKLTARVSETLQQFEEASDGYQVAREEVIYTQNKFEETMATVLEGLQLNEEARIQTMKASLRRHQVVETSLIKNREYDLLSFVQVMEDVDPAVDLRHFVEQALTTPALEQMELPPENSEPAPYMPRHRPKQTDLVDDLSFWLGSEKQDIEEEVENVEEMYLGDLMSRVWLCGSISQTERIKLNTTLQALKAKAPFALLRVLLHFTKNTGLRLDDDTYNFFAALMKNMLRKFLSLRDMISAKLVSFVAQRVVSKTTDLDVYHSTLDETGEAIPVQEWESKFFDQCEISTNNGQPLTPEDVLQRYFAMFVDYGLEPREALRVLASIAEANDDIIDEHRFATWVEAVINSCESDEVQAPAVPASPSPVSPPPENP
eukprot:TRINITY_DN8466_c0_g2_i2.p1 TRINITY_DN8466_c0_g2~~TRINITY_DN8466_c0_g2_i2.p1  ORF type:complete len:533 (-),score=73.99 TRINITY_DN8466_c0_g2_i2:90-1688(-)